jgi:hypothetical protein
MPKDIHKSQSGVYRLSTSATNVCKKYAMTASKTILHLENVCQMLQEENKRLVDLTKNLTLHVTKVTPFSKASELPKIDPTDDTPRDKFGRLL